MGLIMDWFDVEDVLFDCTSKDQIDKLRCPDCGGKLRVVYNSEFQSLTIKCAKEGHMWIGHGCEDEPNFCDLVGAEYNQTL